MVLCHDMASRVALVMAPMLSWICRRVGNMGLKNGGGSGGYQGEEYRSSHTVRAG